jgi:poly(A) polymerase
VTTLQQKQEAARRIVQVLRKAGFRALWAGGCVRDKVMDREPEDYDVATEARPDQVSALFDKTVPTGASFGVVLVIEKGCPVEVATFRSDGRYLDGRHPEEVHFSGEREDALRRDFTINGMFYDPIEDRVIDYVGGREDIRAGILRCIGDPARRFSEDRLRLIRAVRFAARFRFRIEPVTFEALKREAAHVTEVSAERIRDELIKILTGLHPADAMRLLDDTGLLTAVLPEAAAMKGVQQPPQFHPEGDVWVHTLLMLDLMQDHPSPELALGVLLHDVGKPPTYTLPRSADDRIRFDNHTEVGARMAETLGRRLKLSADQVERVTALVRDHLKFKDVRNMRASTLKRFLRQDHFEDHLELHRLDCLGSHGDLGLYEFCRMKLSELSAEEIRPPRLIGGEDLIAMGYTPGPLFSTMLTAVEDEQLEGRVKTRDEAMEFVNHRFPVQKAQR